jgi:DNA mismatch repair protein MutS2
MNKKILQILEYDKVKEQFMNALTTAQGQQELKDLKPLTDKEKIQLLLMKLLIFAY